MKQGQRLNMERDGSILKYWDMGYTGGQVIRLCAEVGFQGITLQIVAGVVKRAPGQREPRSRGNRGPLIPHSLKIKFREPLPKKPKKPKKPPTLTIVDNDEPQAIGIIGDIPDNGFCKHFKDHPGTDMQACGQPTEGKKHAYCPWHENKLKRHDMRTAEGKSNAMMGPLCTRKRSA